MGTRFAAGLAITAALLATTAVKAQGWFGNYELSPRQIVGVLEDDGYEVRGSMLRRGDVYVLDAVSVSGRPMRLIVSAHDGRVLDRYATDGRRRWADENRDAQGDDWGRPRPPRNVGADDQDGAWSQPPRDQMALGDQYSQPSRVYGGDLFGGQKAAPAAPDSPDAPKPKHHASKKHHDTTAVAKAPADAKPTPDAVSTEPASPAPSASPSVAAVQPSAPEKAAVEPPKPTAAPTPEAVAPAAAPPSPQPSQAASEPVEKHANVEAEKAPAPVAPAPKPEAPKKKINDLPVGTLD